MYADSLNLVSSGVGDLMDGSAPHSLDTSMHAITGGTTNPLELPWAFKGNGWTSLNPVLGAPATQAEIIEEWKRTKLDPRNGKTGGGAYAGTAQLTLSVDAIRSLFEKVLGQFEHTLKSYFPDWDNLPADAQFAILAMSWALGPAFPSTFGYFKNSINKKDFLSASGQAQWKGVSWEARGSDVIQALKFAAQAQEMGDLETLNFQGGAPSNHSGGTPAIQKQLADQYAALPQPSPIPKLLIGGALLGLIGYTIMNHNPFPHGLYSKKAKS